MFCYTKPQSVEMCTKRTSAGELFCGNATCPLNHMGFQLKRGGSDKLVTMCDTPGCDNYCWKNHWVEDYKPSMTFPNKHQWVCPYGKTCLHFNKPLTDGKHHCKYIHECQWGQACRRVGCKYDHPEGHVAPANPPPYQGDSDDPQSVGDTLVDDLTTQFASFGFKFSPRKRYVGKPTINEAAHDASHDASHDVCVLNESPIDSPMEPASVESVPVDLSVQPAPVDPAPVNPAPVDPAPADPAPVDPAPVDPAPVNPAPVDASMESSSEPPAESAMNHYKPLPLEIACLYVYIDNWHPNGMVGREMGNFYWWHPNCKRKVVSLKLRGIASHYPHHFVYHPHEHMPLVRLSIIKH